MPSQDNAAPMRWLLGVMVTLWASVLVAAPLEWPAVTNQTRPWTRWWWMGSIVNEADLTSQMTQYARAGLGGLEITPIYGVKGEEDRFIDYLTPHWMEMLVHTLKEGQRLDLGIDMATGNGWPFGGPWIGAADACRNIVYRTYTLKAGGRLDEAVTYMQKPMVRAIGKRMDISDVKEPIGANANLQALAFEQVRFAKPLPLQVLMAYSDTGQTVNLTDKVDAEGQLDWTAPAGMWTLYAVFEGWHGKMVERAGPGGEGNVIDHFSHDALKHYLSHFDEAYEGYDVRSMRAYFNDSYEVDDAAGESNWTGAFFDEFARRRGYDLRAHLQALFGQGDEEQIGRVRCDYRATISDLLLDEFTIPWRQWAERHGATTRNQSHGSPANLLDLYAASGIPETEGTDILGFKLASSAAHVTGKPLASCEAATWMNEHFQGTLGEARQWVDRYFLGGINHICYHGTTFSPADEAWPGWMFYASVHFGTTNSFWTDFAALNQYVTRCQSFLQAGKSDNDVLVYWPIYDAWSSPEGRYLLQHFSARVPRELFGVASALWEAGYTFDYVSDRQLTDVRYADGALRIGDAGYKTVVVPRCRFIPVETFKTLRDLARAGATIIVENQLPRDVPGLDDLAERRGKLSALIASLKQSGGGVYEIDEGRLLVGDDVPALVSAAGVKREAMVSRGLEFVRRKLEGGTCYFVLHGGQRPLNGWIPLGVEAASVAIFDPMQGSSGLAALRRSRTATPEVYLQLAPGQSCLLRTFDKEIKAPVYPYFRAAKPVVALEGPWTVRFVQGGPTLPATMQTASLGSWTDLGAEGVKAFSGTACYTMRFDKPEGDADAWRLDLGRVCESARVVLNGAELGTVIGAPYRLTIPAKQLKAENTLEVYVSNLMANRIADLDRRGANYKKFYNVNFPARRRENRGRDGYFNAARWKPQDSGLLGPVELVPLLSLSF